MHIAFLTPEYPHEKVRHSAGIGTSIKNLAVALEQKGVTVSIIVYGQSEDNVIKEQGITIHLVKKRKYKWATWYFYRKYLERYLNALTISEKITLIEAPDWTGITAFMNLKAPLIIRFHGSDAYFCHLENRKQKRKNFYFEKWGIGKAKAYIAPTAFAGKLTQEIFNIKDREIATIHNGIDTVKFRSSETIIAEKGLLLYIGTLIRKKGVLEFPGIMKYVMERNPEAHLILIGNDSSDIKTGSASTWKLLADSLDDKLSERIQYLGQIPYEEVRSYIEKAQVCLFPTFAETLGMVTIESMAMGKPVVNSNIGWANELIVDSESGFLVHPTDHKLYANRIVQLLESEEMRTAMGKKAIDRAQERFNITITVEQNIAFYKKIIGT
ncbi:glycosyltransferase family 4 protein [Flavobacterium cerinum]|uniref:Glycosyltransferase family 4 protein n=2 Tax=Flavobacterium cerinum TaxID=2502784 RepID=A0ABY5IWZ4_9FLAO|nr:glycosyltransferase family 4 protein [Flavobacterium cerinum]UUC47363.1 glycosyltransferase family 4 protein [Flavobacterium cerinum]